MLIALLLICSNVLADPSPVAVFPGGSAMDLLNSKSLMPPPLVKSEGGVQLKTTCTDSSGKISSSGDAEYEQCLKTSRPKSSGPSSQSGGNPSVGVTFGTH